MKKLIACLCMCLLPVLASAQDFGVWEQLHGAHNQKNPFSTLYHKIKRAQAARQKLPWAKLVEEQFHAAQPRGWLGSNNWDHIAALAEGNVAYLHSRVYEQRMRAWQQALLANPVLDRFTMSAPDAKTVATLPDEYARYITAFLQAPTTVLKQDKHFAPASAEAYKHFIVRVTLKPSPDAWPVHLIFNCYSKQVYVSYPWLEVPGITFERLK